MLFYALFQKKVRAKKTPNPKVGQGKTSFFENISGCLCFIFHFFSFEISEDEDLLFTFLAID
jgi:hypothetical protein